MIGALAQPIRFRVSGGRGIELVGDWPAVARMCDDFVLRSNEACVRVRYPFMSVRFSNARAVYRVETRDLGMWNAVLVEGYAERENRAQATSTTRRIASWLRRALGWGSS